MTRAAAWLVVLALAVAGCRDGRRRDGASSQASSDAAGAPRFARGQLEAHFAKHGAELGAATKEEYLARAQALVRGGPGIDTLTQGDGDTCFFEEATGELAVVSARRVLRTYFKPRDGRRYFERQRGR